MPSLSLVEVEVDIEVGVPMGTVELNIWFKLRSFFKLNTFG